jgi:hypothetical protein
LKKNPTGIFGIENGIGVPLTMGVPEIGTKNRDSQPRRERFPIHEIGRIDGGRGFRTGKNVFRIGGNTFYDLKNKIQMTIPEFKRSGIGLIVEFRKIPNGFPNQVLL